MTTSHTDLRVTKAQKQDVSKFVHPFDYHTCLFPLLSVRLYSALFFSSSLEGFPLDVGAWLWGVAVGICGNLFSYRSVCEMLRRFQVQFLQKGFSGVGSKSGLWAGHPRSSLQPSPPHRVSRELRGFVHRAVVTLEQGLGFFKWNYRLQVGL